jgi:protein tyrosine phosphatase (PTP) superfamily phosphohydrolase (DUF442 family)
MDDNFSHIRNFRQVTPALATSGQPKEDDLKAIADAGYEVVINLALHNDPRYSLADEAGTVAALKMTYIHIPVQFDNPTVENMDTFFDAVDQHKHRKLWVHCAANYRVTAFVGLYRVVREGWERDRAFELMNSVWQPQEYPHAYAVWTAFIERQLAQKNVADPATSITQANRQT